MRIWMEITHKLVYLRAHKVSWDVVSSICSRFSASVSLSLSLARFIFMFVHCRWSWLLTNRFSAFFVYSNLCLCSTFFFQFDFYRFSFIRKPPLQLTLVEYNVSIDFNWCPQTKLTVIGRQRYANASKRFSVKRLLLRTSNDRFY